MVNDLLNVSESVAYFVECIVESSFGVGFLRAVDFFLEHFLLLVDFLRVTVVVYLLWLHGENLVELEFFYEVF